MFNRDASSSGTPRPGRSRTAAARLLAVALAAQAAVLLTASPASAQVGDPAYGAGPGVSSGLPTVAGQAPGRGTTSPAIAAQALPNTGSGPSIPSPEWGALVAGALGFAAVAASRLLSVRRGRLS
jgi:hypothetical protein